MTRDRAINRRHNDELRMHLLGGGTLVTQTIATFDLAKMRRLLEQLAKYDRFCAASDPSGEHAFGAFDFEGTPVVFHIATEPATRLASSQRHPIPAERIMTIMLAEEYAARSGVEACSLEIHGSYSG